MIVAHKLPLEEAPRAYAEFQKLQVIKPVLKAA